MKLPEGFSSVYLDQIMHLHIGLEYLMVTGKVGIIKEEHIGSYRNILMRPTLCEAQKEACQHLGGADFKIWKKGDLVLRMTDGVWHVCEAECDNPNQAQMWVCKMPDRWVGVETDNGWVFVKGGKQMGPNLAGAIACLLNGKIDRHVVGMLFPKGGLEYDNNHQCVIFTGVKRLI